LEAARQGGFFVADVPSTQFSHFASGRSAAFYVASPWHNPSDLAEFPEPPAKSGRCSGLKDATLLSKRAALDVL